jgi:hypothetical protein
MVDINQFKTMSGNSLPKYCNYCWGSINPFPDLIGTKLDQYTLMYMSSINPEKIVITNGQFYCDSSPGRLSIAIDANDIITYISFEVKYNTFDECLFGGQLQKMIKERINNKNDNNK